MGLTVIALWSGVAGAEELDGGEAIGEASNDDLIEVVIAGDPISPSPRDPTPSRYLVEGRELSAPGLDLADALDRVPGMQTSRTGSTADPSFAALRGARSAHTPVYLASIRLNDDITGQADLSSLPAWILHRGEVFRGSAPRWVDELGLGGAILLEPRLPTKTEASAALGAGSFGAQEARVSLGIGDRTAGALLAIGHRSAKGDFTFMDDGGTRFDPSDDRERRRVNGDHGELDAWAIGRVRREGVRLMTIAHVFAREAGAPGLLLPGARHSRVKLRRRLGGASAEVDCGSWCSLAVAASYLDAHYRLSDPLREIGHNRQTDNRGLRTTSHARLELRPHPSWAIGAGLGHTRSTLALDADAVAIERARRHALRPAVDLQWSPLPGLGIVSVGALDCHTTRGSGDGGDTCGILEPSGRLGARYNPLPEIALFGNGGRYLRVPTLGEKYGTSAAVLGNPDLAVEKGASFELGLATRARLGAIAGYAEVVGFARWSSDLVAYRRASLGAVRPYNVAAARVLGLEVVMGARIHELLRAEVALTVMDPRDTSDERQLVSDRLPYVAPLAVVPSLELRSPPVAALRLERAALDLRYRHQAARPADPAGLIELPAQDLVDLGLSLAFEDGLALRARAENLLDDRTFDLIGYPLPGRAFHGLVEVAW